MINNQGKHHSSKSGKKRKILPGLLLLLLSNPLYVIACGPVINGKDGRTAPRYSTGITPDPGSLFGIPGLQLARTEGIEIKQLRLNFAVNFDQAPPIPPGIDHVEFK